MNENQVLEYLNSMSGIQRSQLSLKNISDIEPWKVIQEMDDKGIAMEDAVQLICGPNVPFYPTPMTIRHEFNVNKIVMQQVLPEDGDRIPNKVVEFLMNNTVRFVEYHQFDLMVEISKLFTVIKLSTPGDNSVLAIGLRKYGVDGTFEVFERMTWDIENNHFNVCQDYRKLFGIRVYHAPNGCIWIDVKELSGFGLWISDDNGFIPSVEVDKRKKFEWRIQEVIDNA